MTDNLRRSFSRLRHGVTYRGLVGTLTLNDDDSLAIEYTVAGRLFQSYLLPGWTVDEAADEYTALVQRANAYGWHQDAIQRVHRVLAAADKHRRARTTKAFALWLNGRALDSLDNDELLRLAYHLAGVAHYKVMAQRPEQNGFVHDWLVPKSFKGRSSRHLKRIDTTAPDSYARGRVSAALWHKQAEQNVQRALEADLTVRHRTDYESGDWEYDWLGEIVWKQTPAGDAWKDYVPLVNNREYAVADGEDTPSRWVAYFVPAYGFQERLETYRSAWFGMARHDAWNAARREIIKSAKDYLKFERGSVGIKVLVNGTVVHDEVWYTMGDYDIWPQDNEDGDEDALRILAEAGELGWVIKQAEAAREEERVEQEELLAGQVGPR